jgi:hypothetical protein
MPVLTEDGVFGFARLEEALPSSVTITRTSEQDYTSRQLIVSIDGARLAALLWGDSISSELTPCPRTLRVNNTLLSLPCLLVLGAGPLYVTVRRRL